MKQNTMLINFLKEVMPQGIAKGLFYFFLIFTFILCFMCFLACVSVHHELAVPVVARRWHQIP